MENIAVSDDTERCVEKY